MKRTTIGSLLVAAALVGTSIPAVAQQYPPTTPQGPVVVNPNTQREPEVVNVTQTSTSRPALTQVFFPISTGIPALFNVEISRAQIGNTVLIWIWVPLSNSNTMMLEDPDALVTMQAARGQRQRVGKAKVRPDGTVKLPVLSFRKAGTYQIQIQDRKAKRSNWFNVKAERPKKAKTK
jgi:hypothetical protein